MISGISISEYMILTKKEGEKKKTPKKKNNGILKCLINGKSLERAKFEA